MNVNKKMELHKKQLQTKVQVYTYYFNYHILTIVENNLALHNTPVSGLSSIT